MQLPMVITILRACRYRSHSLWTRRTLYSVNGIWDPRITKATLRQIDNRWREALENPTVHTVVDTGSVSTVQKKPFYVLCMFPYPSGKLHMGHVRVYTIGDVLARYHRLTGKQVINPIGWDAFGLPAENAAIERGLAPDRWTHDNIENMRKQLKDLCYTFDWDREIKTCDPTYYKWTQLIFLKMFEKGLAYCKEAPVNWDPVDQTVLADEQIDENGKSWRSGAQVVTKYLRQWYLRATAFSEVLLQGLDSLEPAACRSFANLQRHWIGPLTGCRITLKLQEACDGMDELSVFTDTPELLHGVSFVLLSEKHPLSLKPHAKDKDFCPLPGTIVTGKLKMMAVNPLTRSEIPVFIGSMSEGDETLDARLGIPTVRASDIAVCTEYSLPHISVLDSTDVTERLVNSGQMTGMQRADAFRAIMSFAKERGFGGYLCSSKLNDWLISRQRYWGTPIPIIHCPKCQIVPVPEEDLPVKLPPIVGLSGKGQSPLAQHLDWVNCRCPRCGGAASREVDTMDTFVDSSWYFLRYLDPKNSKELCSRKLADEYMPVDVYVGGAEHACLHMYYARFVTHFLQSEGYLSHKEPFRCHLANGAVHSTSYKVKDSGQYLNIKEVDFTGPTPVVKGTGQEVVPTQEKMSKSKLNGVDPEEFLAEHGVDLTRLYMLAHTAPDQVKLWSVEHAAKLQEPGGGKHSISFPKWFHQLWFTVGLLRQESPRGVKAEDASDTYRVINKELVSLRNKTVRDVTYLTEHTFDMHLALSAIYRLSQKLDKLSLDIKLSSSAFHKCFADSIIMLHPYAPLITTELWEGLRTSPRLCSLDYRRWDLPVWQQRWPDVDADYLLPLHVCVIPEGGGSSELSKEELPKPCKTTDDVDDGEVPKAGTGVVMVASIATPCSELNQMTAAAAVSKAQSEPRVKQKLDSYLVAADVELDVKRGHSARLVYRSVGSIQRAAR